MLSLVCSVCTWWCLWLRLLLIFWCMLWPKLVLHSMNLIKNCWNMKISSPLRWLLACVGLVEIPEAITYMLGCYVSCFELLTCLDNLEIFVLKFEKQDKWWEKIEMGLYCPTSRYRDGFQLHIWMNLSLVVDAETIVLSFWLSMT